MAEKKMTFNEAVDVLTRVATTYRAAEYLIEALTVAGSVEGEIARLQVAKKEAEEETAKAYDLRDKAKAMLETAQARLKEVEDGFAQKVEERKAQADKDILAVKNEARAKMDQIRAEHEHEVEKYLDSLKAKLLK